MATERDFLIHPIYIKITLVLGSITALFLGFSFAYIYSRIQSGEAPVDIPILFLIGQIFAWNQMIAMNIGLASSNMASYLYVISAIHLAHVIGGLPFLGFFIRDARKRLVEPASVLVYLSDPDKKRRLMALSIYWHFIDALWIYLIIFFLVNRMI